MPVVATAADCEIRQELTGKIFANRCILPWHCWSITRLNFFSDQSAASAHPPRTSGQTLLIVLLKVPGGWLNTKAFESNSLLFFLSCSFSGELLQHFQVWRTLKSPEMTVSFFSVLLHFDVLVRTLVVVSWCLSGFLVSCYEVCGHWLTLSWLREARLTVVMVFFPLSWLTFSFLPWEPPCFMSVVLQRTTSMTSSRGVLSSSGLALLGIWMLSGPRLFGGRSSVCICSSLCPLSNCLAS